MNGKSGSLLPLAVFCLGQVERAGDQSGVKCRGERGRRGGDGLCAMALFRKCHTGRHFSPFIELSPVLISNVLENVVRWYDGIVGLTVYVPLQYISEVGTRANVSDNFVDSVGVFTQSSVSAGLAVRARLRFDEVSLLFNWVTVAMAPWNGVNGSPADENYFFQVTL